MKSTEGIENINKLEYNKNQKTKFLADDYVKDPELLKEYHDLMTPVKRRMKFTFFYNMTMLGVALWYSKNIVYFTAKFFPNRRRGTGNLILLSLIHSVTFMSILVFGNMVILGTSPAWFRKYREIDNKMIGQDGQNDLTINMFFSKISEYSISNKDKADKDADVENKEKEVQKH